ncbi:MAG: hypothetical protein DRH04_04140 [Deltaproteobacteria bacterium]|nr:MAG: hypothetical protein DRH04_04140 [Deltaproteobacteria bacterium]
MTTRKRRKGKKEDPLERLGYLAKELNLTSLSGEVFPRLIEEAREKGLSYSDFALNLLELEIRTREDRRLNRNLKRSRLGIGRDLLEDYDFSRRPKLKPQVVRELLNCRWVEEKRNVICVGRPGLGKTRILRALGRAACDMGFSVYYGITAEILEDLQASLADGTFKKVFRRYQKPDVLILDEFGYEPFAPKATSFLFRLVSLRHGSASTLLAANTGFAGWKAFFPSEAQAVATVDRLVDQATILHFTGKSFRRPRED